MKIIHCSSGLFYNPVNYRACYKVLKAYTDYFHDGHLLNFKAGLPAAAINGTGYRPDVPLNSKAPVATG